MSGDSLIYRSFPGPCQFPTLGFVVQRYNQVKAFIPEDFWYILLSIKRRIDREEKKVDFTWRRGHLFEVDVVNEIYEDIMENPLARVTKVTQKSTKKWCVFYLHLRLHPFSSQETTTTDDRRASKGRITTPQASTQESFGCMSICQPVPLGIVQG